MASFDKNSSKYAFFFALTICLVGSIIVSVTAIGLRPLQEQNRKVEQQVNILRVGGLYQPGTDVPAVFAARVQAKVIDFETGDYVEGVDPLTFDPAAGEQVRLSSRDDIAGIKSRPRQGLVYILSDEQGEVANYVFPVHGYGLWSTMYALIALKADGNTIESIRYYQHGETPGLGGEIDNPRWTAQWVGKQIYDEEGGVAFRAARGAANPDDTHAVDGLAGATLTTNGVTNTIRYWFSDDAYKRFIDRATRG